MKVLIFSLAYLPFVGGAEVAIKEITDRLGDIEFDMITTNLDGKQKQEEKIGNVNIHRIGSGKFSKYTYPWEAIKKAKELNKNYDIVWAMMANQAGIAAMKFKKINPKVKYLLTLQEGDSLKRIWSRTWFMRGQYKNIYRKADRIQSISNFLSARAKKYDYKGQVDLVPNGVDIESFTRSFSDNELQSLRLRLDINKEDKVVITTSRLVYKNGIDILIKAIKDVPAKLLILGGGPLEKNLKGLAKKIKVEDRVQFLGHVNNRDLSKYLSISDIFVRPSRSEGLGISFLEAMAAGLPIIAPNVGGISDFLKDGQTGLFCKVDDPRDLAVKIKSLLDDDNFRQTIISNGNQLVLNNYSWDQVSQKMKNIFNTI